MRSCRRLRHKKHVLGLSRTRQTTPPLRIWSSPLPIAPESKVGTLILARHRRYHPSSWGLPVETARPNGISWTTKGSVRLRSVGVNAHSIWFNGLLRRTDGLDFSWDSGAV